MRETGLPDVKGDKRVIKAAADVGRSREAWSTIHQSPPCDITLLRRQVDAEALRQWHAVARNDGLSDQFLPEEWIVARWKQRLRTGGEGLILQAEHCEVRSIGGVDLLENTGARIDVG